MNTDAGGCTRIRRDRALSAWVVGVVVAAVAPYLPSLRGEFVLDDWALIVRDPLVHKITNLPYVFFTDFLRGSLGPEVPYYRPLVTASFQLNYWLAGPNPLAFRLTNVALHVLASLLVFALGLRLTKNTLAAGLAGAAFALLPAHAEPVAWISGRTDIMSCVFVVSAFLVLTRGGGSGEVMPWPRAALGGVLFLCGLFSKENAMVLPGLVLAYLLIFDRSRIRREGLVWIAVFLVPLILYALLRREAMDVSLFGHFTVKLKERLAGVGIAYASYLRMLFVPRAVKVIYDVFPIGIRQPWIAAAAWMIPIGLALAGLKLRGRAPVVSLGAWWILLALLPVSNIILTLGPLPAERFSYLASVGSALMIGWVLSRVWEWGPRGVRLWKPLVSVMIGWYLLYCAALTIEGSYSYITNTAWAKAIAASNGRFLRGAAGEYLAEAGYLEEAQRELEAALRYEPDRKSNYIALTQVYEALGKREEAFELRKTAEARFGEISTP